MPTGVYKRAADHNTRISDGVRKAWLANGRREKASKRMMGNNWNIGKHLSEEHKKAISNSLTGDIRLASNKGKPIPETVKAKISASVKGKIPKNLGSLHTDKAILAKKGLSLIGNKNSVGFPAPNKGVPHTDEAKRKMSESHKGDKNYNWQGGISSEKSCFSASSAWRDAKRKVVKRDGACLLCGKPYVPFKHDAHHIIPFRVKEERLSIKNLILLCKNCHRQVHSKKVEFIPWAIKLAVMKAA
jgi:hypothetical protein